MKYDKDTMNSLQEAYASVNEVKYYSGKDRNKKTGTPKKLQNQTSTTSNKKPKGSMPSGGDGTAYMGEEQEPEGMKYSDKKKIQRQKQLLDASKKAPVVKNKIVPMKTRTEEAIKMTKKEYAKTHKDFKSDDKKNPRVTRYVPGKGTVSTPVELTDQVDKKKEMEDKMKEVEDMRSLPTRMNLIKTKLRAMGLNMSHVLKGKELSEVIDYALDEATRYKKEKGYDVGGTKKPTSPKTPDPALDAVKAKYKDQIMRSGSNQPKKVKGAKSTVGTNKYKDMADQKKETAADAKKRGFDNVQSYVDAMARYGGKKNYDQGKGLGS
jgi:hypothetical protein